MGDAPWTSAKEKIKHEKKHGKGIANYLDELNAVYKFIYENHGQGGQVEVNGRWFTITCVPRLDGAYEYAISIHGGNSDRTLVLDPNGQVITYCRRDKPEDVTYAQGNTGGASSSTQYQ